MIRQGYIKNTFAARRRITTEEPQMETQSTFTLLVPLDGSKLAEQALGLASTLAGAGGSIDLIHIVPMPDAKRYPIRFRDEAEVRNYWQYEIEEARKQLREVAARWTTSSRRAGPKRSSKPWLTL